MKKEQVLIATRDVLPGEIFAGFIRKEKLGGPVSIVHDGETALNRIIDERPGLIILDVFLPVLSGAAVMTELKKRNLFPPVICFCRDIPTKTGVRLFKAGIRAIIDYESTPDQIIETIIQVKAGKTITPDRIVRAMENRDYELNHEKYRPMTKRQNEVLHLAGEGCSNDEIAYQLHINRKTVEKHKSKIRDKLGLASSYEIAIYALTHGYIEIKEEAGCL